MENDGIGSLSDESLGNLSNYCAEMIRQVCTRLNDEDLSACVRRLMKSTDLLDTFNEIQRENRGLAAMVLNAGLATLVNSQSVIAIDNEFRRRAAERN